MFSIQRYELHHFDKGIYNQNTMLILWDIRYLDAILTSVNIIIILVITISLSKNILICYAY